MEHNRGCWYASIPTKTIRAINKRSCQGRGTCVPARQTFSTQTFSQNQARLSVSSSFEGTRNCLPRTLTHTCTIVNLFTLLRKSSSDNFYICCLMITPLLSLFSTFFFYPVLLFNAFQFQTLRTCCLLRLDWVQLSIVGLTAEIKTIAFCINNANICAGNIESIYWQIWKKLFVAVNIIINAKRYWIKRFVIKKLNFDDVV